MLCSLGLKISKLDSLSQKYGGCAFGFPPIYLDLLNYNSLQTYLWCTKFFLCIPKNGGDVIVMFNLSKLNQMKTTKIKYIIYKREQWFHIELMKWKIVLWACHSMKVSKVLLAYQTAVITKFEWIYQSIHHRKFESLKNRTLRQMSNSVRFYRKNLCNYSSIQKWMFFWQILINNVLQTVRSPKFGRL